MDQLALMEDFDDLVAKLTMLERRLGDLAPKAVLEPFPIDPNDPVDLQRAAKRIAEFLGLTGLTFIVGVAKQDEKVGAHVELRYAQTEVFIELSSEVVLFEQATLASLAHEIVHKYLHEREVWIEPVLENERLTDVAGVYLGLGKLLINGAEDERFEIGADRQVKGVHKVTGGYLTRPQLALVYACCGHTRELPPETMTVNLTAAAVDEVAFARRAVAELAASNIDPVAAIRAHQKMLTRLEKDLVYLRDHVVPAVEQHLVAAHTRLHQALGEMEGDEVVARSARGLRIAAAARRAHNDAFDRRSEANRLRLTLAQAVDHTHQLVPLVPERSAAMFRIVRCHHDGTKLRLPAKKSDIVARCPKCRYRFAADSTVDGPEPPKPPTRGWRRWFKRS